MKSKFLNTLAVELVKEGGDKWRLVKQLQYQSGIFGGVITVPAGYVTNFASVPKTPLLQYLFGDVRMAAVVHDWLYDDPYVTQETADEVFKEAMKASGVGWKRYPMTWAVNLFGGMFKRKEKSK